MGFLGRTLSGIFLLSAALALVAWAGTLVVGAVQERMADEGRAMPARERVFAVNVIPVEPATIRPVTTAYGEVQSARSLDLRARIGGRIATLAPEMAEGAEVVRGTVLAQIDPADAEAALARAEADLADAEAEARDARQALALARDDLAAGQEQAELRARALARQRDLLARGAGTAAAVETAELAAASAGQAVLSRRQALAEAEARLARSQGTITRAGLAVAEARRALEDTVIAAPFDGVLADVSVGEGGLVSANEHLATLIDGDALEVSFRLSTTQFARLVGPDGALADLPVSVSLDLEGLDLRASGRLVRAAATVAEGETGRRLFAALGAAPGLRPGDFVTVRVEEPPLADVARLPSAAVGSDGQVLALGEEDRLEALPAEILRREGDDVIVAAAALAGREIVAERAPTLGAGIRVRPQRPPAPGEAAGVAPAPGAGEAGEEGFVELTAERRAELRAMVERTETLSPEVKARVLAQLEEARVPARVVARIEGRMGG